MNRRISHLTVSALVGLSMLCAVMMVACSGSGGGFDVDQHKKLAGELRDSKLYDAAIEEYEKILSSGEVDEKTQANINYLIARVYYEDIKDYRSAAAYYVRARTLDPDGSFMAEASKNLVASLEKIGQFVDAKRELDAVVDVEPEKRAEGDVPVAVISGDTVWLAEVDRRIQMLPPEIQKQFLTGSAKSDFVRQYVGSELIYNAAVREGYDRDSEIILQREMMYKKLLIDKFVMEKVLSELKMDSADVSNYYKANKETKYDNAEWDAVRQQVLYDYQAEKAEAAYNEYVQRLVEVEKVTFLDHNVK